MNILATIKDKLLQRLDARAHAASIIGDLQQYPARYSRRLDVITRDDGQVVIDSDKAVIAEHGPVPAGTYTLNAEESDMAQRLMKKQDLRERMNLNAQHGSLGYVPGQVRGRRTQFGRKGI